MRRPFGLNRIHAFVLGVALLASVGLTVAYSFREAFPGYWAFAVFVGIGVLLEVSATTLRSRAADGSLSFLIHLPAIPLFGGYWAALFTGVATVASQVLSRRPVSRVVFNTAQRCVAVIACWGVYTVMGGSVRPSLILPDTPTQFAGALSVSVAFLGGSLAYFLANSILVCWAIAISSGKAFSAVWKETSLNILVYDVAASLIALFLSWFYLAVDDPQSLKRFWFLAAFAPIVIIKTAYTKLRTLQELYRELDTAHAHLEENVREQLALMVKSIEARDPYTSGHSRRVSALSKAIAVDFGLSDDLVGEVENAALLHDVGKIHAEFAPLLSKEGKLSPEEWETMKTHAAKSAELVGLFSRFRGHVQDSVRHHHERWDGLGYPDGVRGEVIPLGARIIMVADTIDAMTTDRPYRKALGFEAVASELQKHRGTQFDPRLVDCVMTSVTVRRMIGLPNLGVGPVEPPTTGTPSVPLRSYGSFFLGRRLQ